jgi:lipopolysaccharide biosynthesis glycosyltransferase
MKTQSGPIVLALAADDLFALPLTATLYSALVHLKTEYPVIVYILDGGIRYSQKNKILQSIAFDTVELRWIKPSAIELEKIAKRSKNTYPTAAYYRLLLPQILPEDIHKVIYLDTDLIVLGNLEKLWSLDMGDYYFLAMQEPDGAYVYDCDHLAHLDLKALGITPEHKSCNTGVTVINLDQWRANGVTEKTLNFLANHPVKYADQDALNIVLAGQWGELDPRWNQTTTFYCECPRNPYSPEVVRQVLDEPFIIHYAGYPKPWMQGCTHPTQSIFLNYLNRTAWAGWNNLIWSRYEAVTRRVFRKLGWVAS